jgi:FkbM family methyltransferase
MNSPTMLNKQVLVHDSAPISPLRQQLAAGLMRLRPAFLASFLKKLLLFRRTEIVTSEGMFSVDIASNIGYPLATTGIYESEMVSAIKACLSQNNVFVDLGANEGYFSVIASQIVGPGGRVLAVEPQSRLQPVISKNLNLNSCQNVQILPLAISGDSRLVTLHLTPDMNTGSTAAIQTTRYSLQKQDVSSITLAQLFEQHSIETCHLLKVDIEGYEYEAIMGSQDLFASGRIKAIALELHPGHLAKRNLSGEDIVRFLTRCGYRRDPSFHNTVFTNHKQRMTANQAKSR